MSTEEERAKIARLSELASKSVRARAAFCPAARARPPVAPVLKIDSWGANLFPRPLPSSDPRPRLSQQSAYDAGRWDDAHATYAELRSLLESQIRKNDRDAEVLMPVLASVEEKLRDLAGKRARDRRRRRRDRGRPPHRRRTPPDRTSSARAMSPNAPPVDPGAPPGGERRHSCAKIAQRCAGQGSQARLGRRTKHDDVVQRRRGHVPPGAQDIERRRPAEAGGFKAVSKRRFKAQRDAVVSKRG